MFEGLARRYAVWRYRAVLPRALVRRYGRNPGYTPAQVLATIRAQGLSQQYAAYACALFCSKRAVRAHVARETERLTFDNPAGISTAALLGSSLLFEYDNLRAEVGAPSRSGDASDLSAWGDSGGASDFGWDGSSEGGGGSDGGAGSGGDASQ
ncbi:MAG TPA: DUF6559 family protein [Polyangiaceae bacterium]